LLLLKTFRPKIIIIVDKLYDVFLWREKGSKRKKNKFNHPENFNKVKSTTYPRGKFPYTRAYHEMSIWGHNGKN
jgi:hypothetical protein